MQRYLTGVEVFDTYTGKSGSIVQMNLLPAPVVNPYTGLYTGPYFIVQFTDATLQLFTYYGTRVDHTTGSVTSGVTLLTLKEYNAAVAMGYPTI